jgi:integrase
MAERYVDIERAKILNKNGEYEVVNYNKTDDSARRVYLPSYVVGLLIARNKGKQSDYVTNINPNRFWDKLNQITKRNKIEKLKFHELRHIYSSLTSALGIDIQVRMENGGWSNSAIMDGTYRHSMSEAQEEANEKMNDYVNSIVLK